ncbi:MAG: hypothetical protein H7345_15320 [Rubritepida sp.]|nr:hypothetical protein [Rubritepida sp.]
MRDRWLALSVVAGVLTGSAVGVALATATADPASVAAEDYGRWPLHQREFGSTGGGGVMIGAYDPRVEGNACRTDFTATLADGTVLRNSAEFDAVAIQGGILCTNGRWRSLQSDARGTTPYRVFFRDGVVRGWPQ